MRGSDKQTGSVFSYVDLEERIPARHPLRKIKAVVDAALAALDADFEPLYVSDSRPLIVPERLMRAALVQILISVRSERQLMEQLEYNLLSVLRDRMAHVEELGRAVLGLAVEPRVRVGHRGVRRVRPRLPAPVALDVSADLARQFKARHD